MKIQHTAALLSAAVILAAAAGCDSKPTAGTSSAATGTAAALDNKLLLKEKPAGAISITQARKTAKPGDKIVVSGEIGGRKVGTFNATLATFYIADDTVLANCSKKHGDSCPTPWDYCCDPKEKVTAAIALVQVNSPASGTAAAQTLKGWNGLKELSQVTVTGTVDVVSTPAALVINLEGIYIQP